MSRRSRIVWYGAAALMVLLGAAAAVALSGTTGQLIAYVLLALGLVLATSLAFYEVGLSEDRDRARGQAQGPSARRPRKPPERPSPPRLDRSRGHRRRLR